MKSIYSNQKGAIDIVFIVLLVILLATGGFVAWRVLAADETVQDVASNTERGSTVPVNQAQPDADDETDDSGTVPAVPWYKETKDLIIQQTLPEGWTRTDDQQTDDFWNTREITYKNGDSNSAILRINVRPAEFLADIVWNANYERESGSLRLTASTTDTCTAGTSFCLVGDDQLDIYTKIAVPENLEAFDNIGFAFTREGSETISDSLLNEVRALINSIIIKAP